MGLVPLAILIHQLTDIISQATDKSHQLFSRRSLKSLTNLAKLNRVRLAEDSNFKRGSIEDSSGVPQVWQRRSEGSGTSHNAFSGNFWGDGNARIFGFEPFERRIFSDTHALSFAAEVCCCDAGPFW